MSRGLVSAALHVPRQLVPLVALQDVDAFTGTLEQSSGVGPVVRGHGAHDVDGLGRQCRIARDGQLVQPVHRGLVVLQAAEGVLELGQVAHVAFGATAHDVPCKLQAVAQSLAPDAEPVVVRRLSGAPGAPGRLACRPVPLVHELRHRHRGRGAGEGDPSGSARSGQRLQAVDQLLVPLGIERLEHAAASLVTLYVQEVPQRLELLGGHRTEQLGDLRAIGDVTLELHVEVTHLAEDGAEPTELLARGPGADREHVFKQVERGTDPPGGNSHVVQLLGVLAQPGARLAEDQLPDVAADDGEGRLGHGRARGDGDRSELGSAGKAQAEAQQSGLELGQGRHPEPAGGHQVVHDGLEGRDPRGVHLHLHTPQADGWFVASDDGRVVQCELGDLLRADPQGERAASRPNLDHLVEAFLAGHGRDAAPDRAIRAQLRDVSSLQELGELLALTEPVGADRFEALERRLVVAAVAPRPQHVPRSGHAPILAVEVAVDQPAGGLGQRRQRGDGPVDRAVRRALGALGSGEAREVGCLAGLAQLGGASGQRREPPLDGAQVERVELPFDLDVGSGLFRILFVGCHAPLLGQAATSRLNEFRAPDEQPDGTGTVAPPASHASRKRPPDRVREPRELCHLVVFEIAPAPPACPVVSRI